ncbi:MAG: AbrB/MazE/SpoVT family DNA-binding domain-containing protein [Nitrososphaerales archaeon]
MTETVVDSKGRVVIPDEVRKELGLAEGSKVRVSIADGGGSIIVMKPSLDPDAFIEQTEGSLKRGSKARATDPLRLKEVWTRA